MTCGRQGNSKSNVISRTGPPLIVVLMMAVLLLCTTAASAGYIWTPTGGPSAGGVLCTAFDSARDILYAGTDGGSVYKYESGTWTSISENPSVSCHSMCVDTVNKRLFTGEGEVVFEYDISMGEWRQPSGPYDGQVLALVCDGVDKVVYAGTSNGSVYRYWYSTGTWTPAGSPAGAQSVECMAIDTTRNILYAGAADRIVYRYDGSTWTPTGEQLGAVEGYVMSLAFDQQRNTLYAGLSLLTTGNVNVFRNDFGAGTGWVAIGALCASYNIYSLAVDEANNSLYASAYDGRVYRNCDASVGSTWIDTGKVSPTPDVGGNVKSLSFATGRNVLYGGSFDSAVYQAGIPAVTLVEPPTGPQGKTMDVVITGSNTAFTASSQAVFSGDGVTVNSTTCLSATQVKANITINPLTYTGPRNVWVNTGGDKANRLVGGFTVTDGTPVISSISPESGAAGMEVAVNGTNFGALRGDSRVRFGTLDAASYASWSDTTVVARVPSGLSGDVDITVVTAVGTSNAKKFTVNANSCWYLAEGTNAWGFYTYITLENPNDDELTARLTYMDPNPESGSGVITTRDVILPPLSQTSVSSEPDIGAVDFSTKVECLQGKQIAVDRTMFWAGEGATTPGYHSSIGTTSLSKTWYLPEGSSAWGFETWTLILNPNPTSANVTLTYMTEDRGPVVSNQVVPANSRATYSLFGDMGVADASIQVSSDVPVVAERSMYRNDRREGSCSIGATTPATDYFLAEGSTACGFTTYILVQNPNDEPAEVHANYMTTVTPPPYNVENYVLPPNSRKTIKVNDILGGYDLSTQVHGSKPIIAERAMYWDNGTGEAFHASIGLPSPHMSFFLPDGQTQEGCETWTLVQNPNPGAVTVRITYLPQGGGDAVTFTDEIPPGTRSTYNMADELPSGRASILVESLDGARPVMAERAMYWNNRGGGTDTIGGYAD